MARLWNAPKWRMLLLISPVIIVVDQITKLLIISKLHLHESVPVIPGFFNLTYIHNLGAAFGMLNESSATWRTPFFIIVPMLALGFVAQVFRTLPAAERWMSTALALIVGGAIGNFIDRVRLGWVVDFLDFHWNNKVHFWIFNVADSAITVGVVLILIDSLIRKKKHGVMHVS
jgi:signal peptidase II